MAVFNLGLLCLVGLGLVRGGGGRVEALLVLEVLQLRCGAVAGDGERVVLADEVVSEFAAASSHLGFV